MGGESVHSRSLVPPLAEGCPAHLPTHRLPKRRSARMRVHAQERTRAGACARRSRTAPPSSLPLRGEAEPEEGGASEGGGEMPSKMVASQPLGRMARTA